MSLASFRPFLGKDVGITIDATVSFHLLISCACFFFLCVDPFEGILFPLFLLVLADKLRKQMQEISLGIKDGVVNLPIDLYDEAVNETRFSLIRKRWTVKT